MDLVGSPSGLLELVYSAAQDISQSAKNVKIHRRQCMQLAKRCSDIIDTLRDDPHRMEASKMTEAADNLEDVLISIRERVVDWATLTRVKAFMRQDQMAIDIDTFNQTLDNHVTNFQLVSAMDLHRYQRRLSLDRQRDQEEVKTMLQALVKSVEDLQSAVRMRDDVPALMRTIQTELVNQDPETDGYQDLQGGLKTLHTKTGILPPLTNCKLVTGQVTMLGEYPLAEGGSADIYKGQWVGEEKVMLKAVRQIGNQSVVKRFEKEVDIWRRLQNNNILRFYGICYIGSRLFAVAPWADNGNLNVYLKKNPHADRLSLLTEVARGLKFLHTFNPRVVHGDLRGDNVLVSATGEALLIDFGLSKFLADQDGLEIASTSLKNAGSARWMAPELFDPKMTNSYSVSTESDAWSFGMLCLEALSGLPPYSQCKVDGQVIFQIMNQWLPERPEQSDLMLRRGLSEDMWKLMNHCWSWDPSLRPDAATLSRELSDLQVEHMRQYGIIGDNNNLGMHHPAQEPYPGPVWATPPSSSSNSLPSLRSPFSGMRIRDSPTPYVPELPSSPTSPVSMDSQTPRNNTLGIGGIPIVGRRNDSSQTIFSATHPIPGTIPYMHRTLSEAGHSEADSTYPGDFASSLPRSPTQDILAHSNRNRGGTINSHTSGLAFLHPEGLERINYDENGKVLNGNLEGLADRLLTSTISIKMDEDFRECFLTVYRGFVKADDLLPLLIERFKIQAYGPMQEVNRVKFRRNMLLILSEWLRIQQIEPKDAGFLCEMGSFVSSLPRDDLVAERRKLENEIRAQLSRITTLDNGSPAAPSLSINLLDIDPTKVANELWRIESELFGNILPSDYAAWVKNVQDEQLVNLPRFMKNNYKIADWTQSTILFMDSAQIERRAAAIDYFRRVAEECIRLRAFSTAHAIMAGISSDFVNALSYTWRLVERRTKDALKAISLTVSDIEQYEAMLDGVPGGSAVPILTNHLKLLRREYTSMKTNVTVDGEELVNFRKFEEVWIKIKDIVKYKTTSPILGDDTISAFLKYQLFNIQDGIELQNKFKFRSEDLQKKEQKAFKVRQLGMQDAGFRIPKSKKK